MSTCKGLWRIVSLTGVLLILASCADDGGRDTASGIDTGPPAANQPVTPINPTPVSPSSFNDAESIQAQITSASIGTTTTVDFVIADQDNIAIDDLTASSVRFTIAQLVPASNGDSDYWQSYINQVETAGSVGPGTVDQIQATAERGSSGTLENLGDGAYRYTFDADIQNITTPLAVDYDANLTHRIAIQFSGQYANPVYTWLPATGATAGIQSLDVVATQSCNRCHDPLSLHGGGRRETGYCVTCHNPGSVDANSGNTVDFKVMIHKIHMGEHLPSVESGGEYVIYGHNDNDHDYSEIAIPMDIRNCTACHAGTATGGANDVLTNEGDFWATRPTMQACGSCHDDVDFATHAGGQADNSDCAQCHTQTGDPESVVDVHKIPIQEAASDFAYNIIDISQTAPGEFPQIQFSVTNPGDGSFYDLANDAPWTVGGGASRLYVTIAWDTDDYGNTGNDSEEASSVGIDALASASANGDGTYTVTSPVAIPDGSAAPNIAATGSGVVTIEGHPAVTIDSTVERIPVTNVVSYFSIDEADGEADERRQVVTLDQCLNCHKSLSLHGSNRTDNLEGCVTCHNPRNTDREVRAIALNPPTDGKSEESLDFKTMIHGIHGAGKRENPLQIVGYGGFSTYVFDESVVHYPGDLSNCQACHTEDGFTLPLAATVLGTTVDTGADLEDPSDDNVISPTAAVCSSCHDTAAAKAHMQSQGASFATTQAALDAEDVVESCAVCHGAGRSAAVETVHNPHEIE